MLNRPSRTAEHVALFRALESVRSGPQLFVDPYAEAFLPARYRAIIHVSRLPAIGPVVTRSVEWYIDRRWSAGPRASAVVRTKLIDDLVAATVAAGAQQVLLLGAGYDSRALRLPELADLPVYEVDHPATQAAKRRALPTTSANLHFVPVDLEVEDLGEALRRGGMRRDRATVVVWEGVTNYLTAPAVDTTMRCLATELPAGSRIIFTYVDRAAMDDNSRFAGYERWHASVRGVGEGWTFGFHPAELPNYLAERRMRLIEDVSARDVAERYLTPLHRHEPAPEFYRIAATQVL
ncbi:SAM-dependent methyltransferase [Asanoa sp. NPDC049573]|uniref:class I SAM-dependent methyltransferase n=1 Tax=Asanoa sp. NPDC049573 TaxID=3155396 RepID=UPI00342517AC